MEELDSLLLRASRNDSSSSIESMKANVVTALNSLNRWEMDSEIFVLKRALKSLIPVKICNFVAYLPAVEILHHLFTNSDNNFVLHSLLKTVPAEVLDKGKAMADAYLAPEQDSEPENLDPRIKQLESILWFELKDIYFEIHIILACYYFWFIYIYIRIS